MSESVKVAVRCRPMNQRELQQECRNVITIDGSSKSCTLESSSVGAGKIYQFDAAFGNESTTESVYDEVGSYVVEAVLKGYNGTVFAYGQTGCGKSFTMRGFVDKALEHLFEATSTSSSDIRYLALLSYLEIYNEKLRDLLQDNGTNLTLKEDPIKGTYVAGGLREVRVKDAPECRKLVEQGDKRRAAAATKMNQESSRSHAVMTLSLEALAIKDGDGTSGPVRRGRLHLVDLAGSERQSRTGAAGERLKEAASINLSLSALGNVISALAAGNGRHVPYRDSKLTRLLRDSLGGNARTLMIACLSPADVDAEETLSTLRYAARARCIKNKPIVNEDPKDALLRQYQLELQRLRKILESNESGNNLLGISSNVTQMEEAPDGDVCIRISTKQMEEMAASDLNGVRQSPEEPVDPEKEERRRKKREAAKQEVLRRLEKLTIGGEALGDDEAKRRRERRRKRLEVLAEALEKSAQEGNGGAFQVYGQLKSTEDALKRMARKAKQLEAEAADLQASWDAERRDLLRRELLATQICEAMIPHLRPGCPFRDVQNVREAATWSHELGRWRLIDASSLRTVPLPPTSIGNSQQHRDVTEEFDKSDWNNNDHHNGKGASYDQSRQAQHPESNGKNSASSGSDDDNERQENNLHKSKEQNTWQNQADIYFKRNVSRIDKILAHAREAKTFDPSNRVSKSGGDGDTGSISSFHHHQLISSLNMQNSAPATSESVGISGMSKNFSIKPSPLTTTTTTTMPTNDFLLQRKNIGGWLQQDLDGSGSNSADSVVRGVALPNRNPPRILEALPVAPVTPVLDATSGLPPNRSHRPIS